MHYAQTRIYRRGLELVATARAVIAELPPGYGFLADQLRRASSSMLLNFAEGHDKPSRREQRRYFATARGSAQEVAACLDVAAAFGVIGAESHAEGTELCDHIVRMLFRFRR